MNERIKKLRELSLGTEETISIERARLLTEFYTSGEIEKCSVPVARAKAFKYINKENQISIQDLMNGLDAIQNDSRLVYISWKGNPIIIELAANLRKIHKDTIDCLIFATAICNCDCIVTMNRDFYKQICLNNSIFEEIQSINKNFLFWFKDLSESPNHIKKK